MSNFKMHVVPPMTTVLLSLQINKIEVDLTFPIITFYSIHKKVYEVPATTKKYLLAHLFRLMSAETNIHIGYHTKIKI